jgi:hypothetical protein
MNDIGSRLLEYLPDPNTVKGGIGSIVENIQSEAPQLVEELLQFHFVMSMLWFVVFIILILIFFGLVIVSMRATFKDDDWFPAVFISGCGLIGCIVGACMCTTWLQIWIAPRLFLLEYVKDLLS